LLHAHPRLHHNKTTHDKRTERRVRFKNACAFSQILLRDGGSWSLDPKGLLPSDEYETGAKQRSKKSILRHRR